MAQSYSVFISAVTREFGAAREALANALQARGIGVKVQRSFDLGDSTTLAKLHDYIRGCNRVISVIGGYCGMFPPDGAITGEFRAMLPEGMARASLTQWEVIFARHYGVQTYFFESNGYPPEQPAADGDDATAQAAWRHRVFDGSAGYDRRQFALAEGLRADVMELDWPNLARPNPSNLPGSIGHLFKGRGDFLESLRESFKHNSATAITGKAVHGLGGVGKTRTAIEYGHAQAADYAATFFLTGKSENDLRDSLAALTGAAVLDLPEKDVPNLDVQVAAVYRWLRTNPGWLLIIDNVDEPAAAEAVLAFLHQVSLSKGHVLITSRVSEWDHMVEPLELDLLSLDAAKELLLESTKRRTKRDDEDTALTHLAQDQLDCLSLALVQAAAYINAQHISFAEYSERFESETAKLLDGMDDAARRNLGYPLSVAATWKTSFAQLGEEGRPLLDMLAWLSIESIPRSLISVWPGAKVIDLGKGLTELSHYSFVHWEADNSAFTVHRLVSQVARDNMDEAARDQALSLLFPWFYAVNPTINADDVRCWPQLLPLLPHALLLLDRTKNLGPFPREASVCDEYATLLRSLERISEAEPLYRRALKIDKARYGTGHSTVATRLGNLSVLLLAAGELDEAEELCRQALKINEDNDGPVHPGIAARLITLAELLRVTGRITEAEPLYRRAVEIDELFYGKEHPEVAIDLGHFARMLMNAGRYDEAEPLYRRVLDIYKASHGDDHPYFAVNLSNLATLLQFTGRREESELLKRRAAIIFLRSSKENGMLVLNTTATIKSYYIGLIESGSQPDKAKEAVSKVITEGGFDPAQLWSAIFD